MNKDNAKDYLPLVQALAEGRVIQFQASGVWVDEESPNFEHWRPSAFRIKPEPREIWVNEYQIHSNIHATEKQANLCLIDGGVTRRYREVIE